ncbi:MAG: competence/damage-inducible protein A [Anaerolineales bacterium]|jgi:nicotinamide-nucleotide amidase
MPAAEIITIGTEILLGEIVDTNSRFIARKLRDAGIDLYRQTSVGDNPQRIASAINFGMQSSEIIITTGGLGPTVDDPTRDAVAFALGSPTEFRQELWEQIKARFKKFGRKPTENNKRQAFVPVGAIAVENPVGTAPAFIMETGDHSIIALPGVPREMEYLLENEILPYLKRRYKITGIIKTRIIHTAGVGESQIDERISDLERQTNPTVGLSAHSGQVDIRITCKADSEEMADRDISCTERKIRERLGNWIYGADEDSLEVAALKKLKQKGWRLAVAEIGLGGRIIRHLSSASQAPELLQYNIFAGGETISSENTLKELESATQQLYERLKVDVCLGTMLSSQTGKIEIHIVLISPSGTEHVTPLFGGPPEYAPRWALNHSLNFLRNL